jgi:Mrp family chromosome partitioning ATPase
MMPLVASTIQRLEPQLAAAVEAHEVRIDPSAAEGRLVFLNRHHHLAAEQFRLMAGRLNAQHPAGGAFLITSPVPADGKTFTALNLAYGLAERSRVLLLELDLRRPSMKRVLGLHACTGDLGGVLRNACAPESALYGVVGTQLTIGFAGEGAMDVRDALQGDGLRQLIAWGRKRFRWVICDAPPVLPISDVSEMAPLSDFVTLVVRARHTPAALLRRSIEVLGSRLRYSILNDGEDYGDTAYKYVNHYTVSSDRG